MCPPARVKTINLLSDIRQQQVVPNAIRDERSEQKTDRGVERFVSYAIFVVEKRSKTTSAYPTHERRFYPMSLGRQT